jgi:hypothetical protein
MKRLALALAVLVWAGCADSTAVAPGPASAPSVLLEDDDLWAMVPAESDLVLFADLAKLRQSPWTRESFDRVSPADGAAGDPMGAIRSMDRVIFAKLPALRDGASVLVAQGAVDREAMRKGFAQGRGGVERSTYRSAELLVRGDEALAFLGKRTAMSGFSLAVRAAIDCHLGLAPGIESETWLKRLRGELDRGRAPAAPVFSLYVRLQPATREALMKEMGEGEALEEFGSRIDLDTDLDATAMGVVRTEPQARDLAGRLAERIRDVRTRPIVAAFGLGSVLDSLRFSSKDNRVQVSLHVSQEERSEISTRMSIVAETLAKMRTERSRDDQANDKANDKANDQTHQEKQQP